MSACTVPGLWNQIRGNPPYLSAQQFYAYEINLLCLIMEAGGFVVYEPGPLITPEWEFLSTPEGQILIVPS